MTIPWWTTFLQAEFLQTWFDDLLVLTVIQVSAVLALALAISVVFPRAAALRSCILLSALPCTLVAPLALLVNSHTGYVLELPLHVPTSEWHAALIDSPALFPPIDQVAESTLPDNFSGYVPIADWSRTEFEMEKPNLEQQLTSHTPSPISTMTCEAWLLVLWAGGTIVGILGIVIAKVRIRRLVSAVEPIDRQRFRLEISAAAANVGIDELPRIGTSRQIDSPVALGVANNAWILIPHQCLCTVSSEQLVQILTHEAAHVMRHDPLIRLCQRVHQAIWWWNPLAHRLNAQLSRAREEICDNVVLNCTDADDYGTTLLALGKLMCKKKQFVGTVGLFGSRWSLEHRINGLLNPRRKIMTKVNRAVIVTVLAAFVTITAIASVTRIDAKESPASDDQVQLTNDRRIEDRRSEDQEIETRREQEHLALHRQFDHLTTAYRHLKAAGLEELAQEIGQRAEAVGKRVEQDHPHPGQSARARRRYRNPFSDAPERFEKRSSDDGAFKNDVRASLRQLHLELRDLRRDVDKIQEGRARVE
jgi:beta-lactamase regulating signal transducer with metallopeptidase domain